MAAMIHLLWLVLMLSWSLEDVNSLTFPYVSFMSQTLANHSYVDLSLVGSDSSGSDSVQCVTDLNTCCINTYGSHCGDWYFPDGNRLGFHSYIIHESRGPQRVNLRRRNAAISPTGVYRCDNNSLRATVYVGLYTTSGGMFYILAMIKPILVSP